MCAHELGGKGVLGNSSRWLHQDGGQHHEHWPWSWLRLGTKTAKPWWKWWVRKEPTTKQLSLPHEANVWVFLHQFPFLLEEQPTKPDFIMQMQCKYLGTVLGNPLWNSFISQHPKWRCLKAICLKSETVFYDRRNILSCFVHNVYSGYL